MRLVLSLRVSTDTQAEQGNGLDVQERMGRAWAKANRHEIVAVVVDAGLSGTLPAEDRPGLTRGLLMIRDREADGILVQHLDRLAREVTVQEAILAEVWRRADARVFSVTTGEVLRDDPDDPMRTAMRQMMGVFAGLDRRMVVKRLRDGRKAKAARGGHAVGPAPYGYKAAGGELVPIPEQLAALDRMLRLRRQGKSTRAIAATLIAEGYPTARGGTWSSPTVARILDRERIRAKAARKGAVRPAPKEA